MQRRYRRYFIMLEVEDKSAGIVQKEAPKGYGKIEVKNEEGILTVNCQNLKNDGKDSRYRWYLINTKKEEPTIVEIGPMELDSKGKGELVWEFNSENVKGSMEAIDNFNVIALALQNKHDKKNLFVPLVGYMDKEKSEAWRYALEKYLYIPSKSQNKEQNILEQRTQEEPDTKPAKAKRSKEEEKLENKSQQEELTKKEELAIPKEDVDLHKKEVYENITGDKEYIPIKGDVDQALEDSKETKIEEKIEEEIKEKIKEKIEEKTEELEESFGAQMQSYIENALKDFPQVNPFINNIENYTWWQIPYSYQTVYRSYMPFISYVESVKGPANYYASKMMQSIYLHQHHIFGILYDSNKVAKYYAYGIPGRKHPSEQPYEGATGVGYWHPCDHGPYNMYSHGYWIKFIDPNTGKIIKDVQL